MKIHVIDLPGTYSLTAYSPEELVARNVVLNEAPDLVVDVVDASNLERNLYLAVQFMELGIPMILAFNMSDLAEARGHSIDIERLSELFQVPIVRMVAHKGQGVQELKQAILQVAEQTPPRQPTTVKYGRHIEAELAKLTDALAGSAPESGRPTVRWLALKLLEGDEAVVGQIRREARNAIAVLQKVEESRSQLARDLGDDAEILIADRRYGFYSGACAEARPQHKSRRDSMSDRTTWC